MRRAALISAIALALGLCLAWRQRAESNGGPIGDLSKELPRIAPKEPKDALKSFKIAPGFRIELVACEPLIRSPVAIDFDEDGRLYVAEFPEYNLHGDPSFKEKGCIKLLEDSDRDGVYDRSIVFADNVPAPTAVACWDGGVFVGSVPNLLFLKRQKGNGKADLRQNVFEGFDRDKAGEGMLNSICWGLDNRFHLCTSSAGGQIRPGDQPKAEPITVRNRFVHFDPRTRRFETISGHGQHGMSIDDWGETFVCDNSNPIHHILYDGRYAGRNPYVAPPPVAANIYERASDPNLERISSFEPWRVVRTKLRMAGAVKGPTEGGRVGGHFTGASGVTIYRGDAFPEHCRGQAFVGEVSNNLVHRMTVVPKGVGFVAQRADVGREFLASSDNWFRPCQFTTGPDGCLYVVDMYRELIETVESIPPEILKHLHPESGVDRGRIWRIVPEGHVRRPAPKLGAMSTAALVGLLDHANGWHRDTASRLLYQRQDRTAIPLLVKLSRDAKTSVGRMTALYALSGQEELTETNVLDGMADTDAHVREHAIRLAERFADRPAIQAKWAAMIADPDPRVRWQLAFSFGAVAGKAGTDPLVRLASSDGGDRWIRFAIVSSSKDRAGALAQGILADPILRATPHARLLLADLVAAIAASQHADDIAVLLQATESLPKDEAPLKREVIATLLVKSSPGVRDKIQSGSVSDVLKEMLVQSRSVVGDAQRPIDERVSAARNLRLDRFANARPLMVRLLDPQQPEAIQKAIVDALGSYDEPAASTIILDAWAGLSPTVRAAATEVLLSRPASVAKLFDALEQGRIKLSELDSSRMSLFRKTADAAARGRAEKLFSASPLSKRSETIAAYKGVFDRTADIARGRLLFRKHCAACHRLEGVGEQIGAELTGIRERGPEFLLVNILDPNREVLPKFIVYQAQTDDGRSVTGMIQNETATSITIRRADGSNETILRKNIESLRSTGLSFMPEGFEKSLSVPEMADLIGYLLS